MTDDEKKLPLNAPAEKESEKKDAGAQVCCGWNAACGQLTTGMLR